MDIGARLQRVRTARNLSQRELARRVGVTNSTISLIEQNKVSPSVSSLKKVLDGIPISLADFFTLDLDPGPPEQPFYAAHELPDVGKWVLKGYQADIDFETGSPGNCMRNAAAAFWRCAGR